MVHFVRPFLSLLEQGRVIARMDCVYDVGCRGGRSESSLYLGKT